MTTHTAGLTPAETLPDPKDIEGPHFFSQQGRLDPRKHYSKHSAEKEVKSFCKHNGIDLRGVRNESLLCFFEEDDVKSVFFLKQEFGFIEQSHPTIEQICLVRDELTSLES